MEEWKSLYLESIRFHLCFRALGIECLKYALRSLLVGIFSSFQVQMPLLPSDQLSHFSVYQYESDGYCWADNKNKA